MPESPPSSADTIASLPYPIETLRGYGLDAPEPGPEDPFLDPNSPFFARARPRTLRLPELLPYPTESRRSQMVALSHIVENLYVALQGILTAGTVQPTMDDVHAAVRELGAELGTDCATSATDSIPTPLSNVHHWTRELRAWLRLKLDMPLRLRARLTRVFYALALSRGAHLNFDLFSATFCALSDRPELIRCATFTLPWRPLYLAFRQSLMPTTVAPFKQSEPKNVAQLTRISRSARFFFPATELPGIIEACLALYVPGSFMGSKSVALLSHIFPLRYDSSGRETLRAALPALFRIWGHETRSMFVDAVFVDLFGTVAHANFVYGVNNAKGEKLFNTAQTQTVFTAVLRLLEAPLPEAGSAYGSRDMSGEEEKDRMRRAIRAAAAMLVFVDSEAEAQAEAEADADAENTEQETLITFDPSASSNPLRHLLAAIHPFVHPSNSGPWTRHMSHLLQNIAELVVFRVNAETTGELSPLRRLSRKSRSAIVAALFPAVHMVLYSKDGSAAASAAAALHCLAFLEPETVLPRLLRDAYPALQGFVEPHRTSAVLRALPFVIPALAALPGFRAHVPSLLTLLLPGIDSNDLGKTLQVLPVFQTAAQAAPWRDTSGGVPVDVAAQYVAAHVDALASADPRDPQTSAWAPPTYGEAEAAAAATAAYSALLGLLLDRVESFVLNFPPPRHARSRSGAESRVISELGTTITTILQSTDIEIRSMATERLLRLASEGPAAGPGDAVATVCAAAVAAAPHEAFPKFFAMAREKIAAEISNGAGKRRSGTEVLPQDGPLVWHLHVLAAVVRAAPAALPAAASELRAEAAFLLAELRGTPATFACEFVEVVLGTVLELRAEPQTPGADVAKALLNLATADGVATQVAQQPELVAAPAASVPLKWHVPDAAAVEFAVALWEERVAEALAAIKRLTEAEKRKDAAKLSEGGSGEPQSTQNADGTAMAVSESRDSVVETQPSVALGSSAFSSSSSSSLSSDSAADSATDSSARVPVLPSLATLGVASAASATASAESVSVGMSATESQGSATIKATASATPSATPPASTPTPASASVNLSDELTVHLLTLANCLSGIAPLIDNSPPCATEDATNPAPLDSHTFTHLRAFRTFPYGFPLITAPHLRPILTSRRAQIADTLLEVYPILQLRHDGDTALGKTLVLLLQVWFADTGTERVGPAVDQLRARYNAAKRLRSVPGLRKPLPPSAVALRAQLYHVRRTLHANGPRLASARDKRLLLVLADLGCSVYPDVQAGALEALEAALKALFRARHGVVAAVVAELRTALEAEQPRRAAAAAAALLLKPLQSALAADGAQQLAVLRLLPVALRIDHVQLGHVAPTALRSVVSGIVVPGAPFEFPDEFVVSEGSSKGNSGGNSARNSGGRDAETVEAVIEDNSTATTAYVSAFSTTEPILSCLAPVGSPDASWRLAVIQRAKARRVAQVAQHLDALVAHAAQSGAGKFWKAALAEMALAARLACAPRLTVPGALLVALARGCLSTHPRVRQTAVGGLLKALQAQFDVAAAGGDAASVYSVFGSSVASVAVQPVWELQGGADSGADETVVAQQDGSLTWNVASKPLRRTTAASGTAAPPFCIEECNVPGWLFFPHEFTARRPHVPASEFRFTSAANATLTEASEALDASWLSEFVRARVLDASKREEDAVYVRDTYPYLYSAVFVLHSIGPRRLTPADALSIASATYAADDRFAHRAVVELYAGLVFSFSVFSEEECGAVVAQLCQQFRQLATTELAPDNLGLWKTFIWWVFRVVDPARVAQLAEAVLAVRIDAEAAAAFRQAAALALARRAVNAAPWIVQQSCATLEQLWQHSWQHVGHHYQSVREEVGLLLAELLGPRLWRGPRQVAEFVAEVATEAENANCATTPAYKLTIPDRELLEAQLTQIAQWAEEAEPLRAEPQAYRWSPFVCGSNTLLVFLKHCFSSAFGAALVPLIPRHILPFLLRLVAVRDADGLDTRARRMVLKLGNVRYNATEITPMVAFFTESHTLRHNWVASWHQRTAILALLLPFYFRNLGILTETQVVQLFSAAEAFTDDPQLEVRQFAAEVFATMLRCTAEPLQSRIVASATSKSTATLRSRRATDREKHAATLRLGALVKAFPYESPPPEWLPPVLATLATRAAPERGAVGKSAKAVLAEFKKTHQDTWHIDTKFIPQEQLDDLEGVLWTSYFV